MVILKIFLIIVGVFYLAGLLLQWPFFYNNMKSKILINKMGRKGYNILLLVFGILFLVVGIII
ncbi:MAG: Imm17 family immunity protein [Bacilli bacterium]|jgi:hypothetical protein